MKTSLFILSVVLIIIIICANHAQDTQNDEEKLLKFLRNTSKELVKMIFIAIEEDDEQVFEIIDMAIKVINLTNEVLSNVEKRNKLIELSAFLSRNKNKIEL